MKIAVITDDEKTISQHFGRAIKYMVFTVEEGIITKREVREKTGHHTFGEQGHSHEEGHHGDDAQSHAKHGMMAETITDCQVIICGGMGMGAYEFMRRSNIQPLVTDMREIEPAVLAYVAGKLPNLTEKLH